MTDERPAPDSASGLGVRCGSRSAACLSLVMLALLGARGRAEDVPERGRLLEGLRCQVDPTQTYTLFLPTAYTPAKAWPALLVLDPRGRSARAAERFVAAAEEYGWILLSSDNTRSDGPREPNARALRALWPEARARYALDPSRIYLAGFSGTGTLAWELARDADDVAGVVVSGSPLGEIVSGRPLRVPCFGTVGETDFNYTPMKALHSQMRKWGTPERLEIFAGPHSWMPAELASEAIGWLELQAMKRGLRPVDATLVKRLLDEDRARAAELEVSGRPVEALRRLRNAASTFDGLVPVQGLEGDADRLEDAASTRRAREEEERWDRYEQDTLRRHRDAFLELARTDPPPVLPILRSRLRLDEVREHAGADGYEGVVGRRLLETLVTQTGFYLMREFLSSGKLVRALRCLEIASELRPERADCWYNLACVRARLGNRDKALDALERAVAAGFTDRAHIASDEDLRSLRDAPRFRALLGESATVPDSGAPR